MAPQAETALVHRSRDDDRAAAVEVYQPTTVNTYVEPVELVGYLRMLGRRWWLVLTTWAVVAGGAALYCFTTSPVYEAKALLLIEPDQPKVLSFKEVLEEQTGKTDYYQTQYQLLRSRTLVRSVLDTLGQWKHPDLAKDPTRPPWWARMMGRTSTVSSARGEAPATQPAKDETAAQSRAINAFLNRLAVEPVRNSRVVNVSVKSHDPEFAARAVNQLARAYIARSLDFRLGASRDARVWLDVRLAEQRKAVAASERALQRYREVNDAISLEDRQNIVVRRLADLNDAVTRAKTERIEKETRHEGLVATPQATSDSVPPTLSSPMVQQRRAELATLVEEQSQLAKQVGERHPDLIKVRAAVRAAEARLEDETSRVIQALRGEILVARIKEQRLTSELESQKSRAHALDRQAIEYAALQREANSSRQLFESLLLRSRETAVAGELQTSNIRLVDSAEVPQAPVAPRTVFIMAVAIFMGLALGLGVALLAGHLDDHIRSPEEVAARIGLPLLGFAPSVPRRMSARRDPLLSSGVPAEFGEALRIIRTNILSRPTAARQSTLVVTSTTRGEGKTVVATNLALALTRAKQRVLLVDGDMRRPRLHEIFRLSRAPGLSDLIQNPECADEVAQQTSVTGLKVVTAGSDTMNPADLLGLEPVTTLFDPAGERYDWILIDSPPVHEVTDACLLARGGGVRVLFVLAADRVTKRAARSAVGRLQEVEAGFAGAVLSRVNVKRSDYGYY